jgi:NhaP-type Na+/H+ or K+/H+ antiporter
MLGFVLGAVSPAVVVPSVLSLHARGYGVDKGISTLIIAASSIDDVIAITGFGVVLGIAFSKGELVWTIVKGPLEAVIGIFYGFVIGIVLWYIPHQKHNKKTFYRFLLLLSCGTFAAFGSRKLHIGGAGPLAVLTLAFVAALQWRKESGVEGVEVKVSALVGQVWSVFQPLLFGLIGAEVSLDLLEASTIGLGFAVLCVSLVTRLIASFIVAFGIGLTLREQFFVPLAWLPKATVQAAIGSVALDMARGGTADSEEVSLGRKLLTIAVLSIVLTAPLGAVAISLSGPRLLHKSSVTVDAEVIVGEQTSLTANSEKPTSAADEIS